MLTGQGENTLQTGSRDESMARIAALLVVIGGLLAAGSAEAQFGTLFNDSPPRPPADVPNGPFPQQPPPVQYPGQYPSSQQYPPQQQYPPPQQQYAAPSYPSARQPASIQAQPLPPPPGASAAPAPANQGRTTSPQPPDATRNAVGLANPPPSQPADTAPQPDDTVVTETPTEKIENGRAVFSGLDKITGRTISFDAAIGETVQFGALQVTARACYTRPPTEATNTDAFVDVDEVTLQGEIKRIFTGWMFASSPGLHAVEHPIYDVWLTNCGSPVSGPVAESGAPVAPAAAVAAPASGRSRQTGPSRQPIAPPPPPPPVTDD
jgi:hypothetical protein